MPPALSWIVIDPSVTSIDITGVLELLLASVECIVH
jgi:hypothetical protein